MKKILMTCMLIFIFSPLFAAQPKFSIIPTAGSITTFLLPSNFTETINYQVTNQTSITRTLTTVPITAVSQTVTGSGICPRPFTLASGQSCTLSLVVNGSQVPATGIMGGPVVCKTKGPNDPSPDPFLCSQPSTGNTLAISVTSPGQHAYIANQFDNTVSFCQVNPSTGFLSQCAVTATGLSGVEGIGFNPAGTFFYSANPVGNSISVCQVNSATGALSNCGDSGGTGFNLPDAIAFNPAGTILYTSNFGVPSSVSACLVNPTTGALSSCVNNISVTFSSAGDMAINSAGTLAYVVNRTNNTTSVCNVSDQSVSSCNAASGSLFNGPEGITLSPVAQFAYIANAVSNNVVVCNIRQDGTGLLDSCAVTSGQFNGTGNIGFNNLGTMAYVPNQLLNAVFVCQVSLVTGSLSSCLPSLGTGFNGPAGVVLH